MPIGHWNGLHQVHSISVDLDEGEDVTGLHRVTQGVQSGCSVWTFLTSKAFLCVFGCDEVFPGLPERQREGEVTAKEKKMGPVYAKALDL